MTRLMRALAPSASTRADGVREIQGYAAVFDDGTEATRYRLFDDAYEVIDPGAFDDSVKRGDDVVALFNHDPNRVLGRTKSGTLSLSVDAKGLRYTVVLSDSQEDRDLYAKIERGDIPGASFGFSPRRVEWAFNGDTGHDVRRIKAADLFDVGPVTFPAYSGTSASARSGDDDSAKQELSALRARRDLEIANATVRAKLTLAE